MTLVDADVEFVLVGGLAAAAYGSPQVTHDIESVNILKAIMEQNR